MAKALNRAGNYFRPGAGQYGKPGYVPALNLGTKMRSLFTDSGVSGQGLGMGAWLGGYGHSTASKLQAGLNWADRGTSQVAGFAKARGEQAALDAADQFAKNYGYEDLSHMINSPAGKMFNAYNRFSNGLANQGAAGWNKIYRGH
jgi:hypothetical protein